MQDSVGEDMAALEIAGELHFVDRHERGFRLARHGLDGADGEACIRRSDLFLAGDQRHLGDANLLDKTRVDLARQQPERQADHAGTMRHHSLNGIMGLAGIGGSEDGGDAAPAEDHGLEIQSLVPRIT